MASKPVILSCADSPLSIASAVVSFLTLAYALLLGRLMTYLVRARDTPDRLKRLKGAIEKATQDGYRSMEKMKEAFHTMGVIDHVDRDITNNFMSSLNASREHARNSIHLCTQT